MSEVDDVREAAIDHHHDVRDVFEAYYRDMAESRFTNAFTYGRAKVDLILDEMFRSLPSGARVLDVGCGTGVYLNRAVACGLVATGVEPAPAMLDSARRNAPGCEVSQGVATALPFPDESFDLVFEIEVLRYLHREDVRTALSEARRVLRPGGRIFVTLVNRLALDGFYVLQKVRQRMKGRAYDRVNPHCEFLTPSEAEEELRRAGFVDVATEGRLFAPFRLAYKVSPSLAPRLAARFERLDDRIHAWPWTRAFAGHLVATGRVR